ncbi:MAG: hypothetical protein PHU63_03975 [Candidatus ainarchaeum sp.]|nr:hypothetical protein [Candidatus ainarchaeum sp.]
MAQKTKKNSSCNCSLNIPALAISLAITLGVFLFSIAMLSSFLGKGGVIIQTLSSFYPGYSTTFFGSLIGAFWGVITGLIFGSILGYFYNYLLQKNSY